jgi:hypothetical protein
VATASGYAPVAILFYPPQSSGSLAAYLALRPYRRAGQGWMVSIVGLTDPDRRCTMRPCPLAGKVADVLCAVWEQARE